MVYGLCYIMSGIFVSSNPLSNDLANYTHMNLYANKAKE